jgi:predicted dinucleotide-binding enzyme
MALVGCGAIGSCLADHLVRSGAQDVALFDKEDFEPGNHARHVLTGNSFEVSKATALKQHLQSGSIHTRLRSFSVTIPNFRSAAGGEALAALRECDVIIDCSAHESAFRWLSKFGADEKKQVVHMFISFEARFLTLVFSGRNVPASLALKSFAQQSRSGSFTALNQSDLDEYWKDPDKEKLVIPGAGCWHATFPARWNHIQCLVGAAIDMIEQRLSAPQLSSGFVAIAKRSDLKLAARGSTPVIEWLYQSPHR